MNCNLPKHATFQIAFLPSGFPFVSAQHQNGLAETWTLLEIGNPVQGTISPLLLFIS